MPDSQSKPSRRGFFVGAAGVGAAVAVATRITPSEPVPAAALAPKPMPEKGGGYSVSEHVQRYYKTAQI